MQVWRANVVDPDEGTMVVWAATEKRVREAAEEAIADSDEDRPRYLQSVQKVTIPEGKEALIFWLNTNLSRDNG